ncbi:hypothetical protein HYV71_03605, partial [Candidatus Uhrbacteria bacterium]|nr:hypothetical protein [Candidatus Uhrbacteria bacterium]
DVKDGSLERIKETYRALRGIVVDMSFDSSTLDELIGTIYSRELVSSGAEMSILEHIRHSLTKDDTISAAVIRNLSNSVSDKMRASTGYGRILYGVGEAIGYLPAEGAKKQPIYLGSRVRYTSKSGDSGIVRIMKFLDPKDIYEDSDSYAFSVLRPPDPSHDLVNDTGALFPLRISEIVDVYDE